MSPARRSFNLAPTPATDRADDWRNSAACLDVDPEIFDPAIYDQRHGSKETAIAEALAVCEGCVVRQQCLEANLTDKWLIVGGTTPDMRASLIRGAKRRGRAKPTRCQNDHDLTAPGARYDNGMCVQCSRDRNARWRSKQKENAAS